MAVKQVFETYVYDLGMSSVAPLPFVMTRVNGAHAKACGAMPHMTLGEVRFFCRSELAREGR
jgi:hypothetical protein